jgi:hypothetical protein
VLRRLFTSMSTPTSRPTWTCWLSGRARTARTPTRRSAGRWPPPPRPQVARPRSRPPLPVADRDQLLAAWRRELADEQARAAAEALAADTHLAEAAQTSSRADDLVARLARLDAATAAQAELEAHAADRHARRARRDAARDAAPLAPLLDAVSSSAGRLEAERAELALLLPDLEPRRARSSTKPRCASGPAAFSSRRGAWLPSWSSSRPARPQQGGWQPCVTTPRRSGPTWSA